MTISQKLYHLLSKNALFQQNNRSANNESKVETVNHNIDKDTTNSRKHTLMT